MRVWLALTVLLLIGAQTMPASAGTIDRIRAEGILHCGGTVRPGLAFPGPDGKLAGLEVDLCRAVATAVLGPASKIDFHPYLLAGKLRPPAPGQR